MAGPKGQVCNLMTLNLVVIGLILITFSLDYMTYTEFVDVGLRKATYYFTYKDDTSFVRDSFESINTILCPIANTTNTATSEVYNLKGFCELIPNFQLAGLTFVIAGCLAITCLVYVTMYLVSIAAGWGCAASFSPGVGFILAVVVYMAAVAMPLFFSRFFEYYSEGKTQLKSGLVAMIATFLLLDASFFYYLYISRTALSMLHQNLEVQRKVDPLSVPLLADHKEHIPAEVPALPGDAAKGVPSAPPLSDDVELKVNVIAS